MSRLAPRLLIAAPASGSGKTTVACALMRAFLRQGLRVASCKCGPDYIDPMFHREAVGAVESANLDLFLGDAAQVRAQIWEQAQNADLLVLEGAMGYYDGLGGISDEASAYQIACVTETPVLLVLDARGASVSLAAQVKGFLQFRPDTHIVGVLLNRISTALCERLRPMIERECGVPVVGCLPPMSDCAFESRHLGLVTAAETVQLAQKLDALAERLGETADLAQILALAKAAPPLEPPAQTLHQKSPVRVAVAWDEAFCFTYAETLRLLERMGAEVVPFSPLVDEKLPERIGGLLLGGGYPELHTERLAENEGMRKSVREAVLAGLPTIAECGGFLYLGRTLADQGGTVYPMCGVLPGDGYPTGKLQRFGYLTMTAKADNLLCKAGEALRAHEFHHWESGEPGNAFAAKKPVGDAAWDCGFATESLYAGFGHLYLAGNLRAAEHFLRAAVRWGK